MQRKIIHLAISLLFLSQCAPVPKGELAKTRVFPGMHGYSRKSVSVQDSSGSYSEETYLYSNNKYNCEFRLPAEKGWQASVVIIEDVIFYAFHRGKILEVFFGVESINADLPDYLLLLQKNHKYDEIEGYYELGVDTMKVNGLSALKFAYQAVNTTDDLGKDNYTFVNVFYKYKYLNYRLIIYTLSSVYERKKDLIAEIYNSFRIVDTVTVPKPAH
jgi:hypothetical protein